MCLSALVPSPIKHIFNPLCGTEEKRDIRQPSLAAEFLRAAIRTTLAATGIFVLLNTPVTLPVALIGGAILSIPATALAAGSILVGAGFLLSVASVAAKAFLALAVGLGLVAAGWTTLHYHNILQFGLVEQFVIDPIVSRTEKRVSGWFQRESATA